MITGNASNKTLRYQAVLFDLDGTLLNTLEDLLEAVNQGLVRLGFPTHGSAEFKYYVGEGREEMARRSLPEDQRDAATVGKLVDFINVYYLDHWSDHTQPYPGVPELLDSLQEKHLLLTVLSNKPDEFTKLAVAGLLSRWHFDMVLGALPGVPKKPDPTAAIRISQQLKVLPQQFLYLGDSGIDMQTAVSSGMYPVGALWGYRPAAELQSCGAKTLIEKPAELLDLLK